MNFVAIDFETANSKRTSICQVGLAIFQNGKLKEQWTSLVNPKDYFEPVNISIHGIEESDVKKAPLFPKIYEVIKARTKNLVVVSHTTFDLIALEQAVKLHKLREFERDWLDTARVARRAWKEFSKTGYGLGNLAYEFGIEFNHHDAGEDARVCGEILVKAIKDTGTNLEDWLERVQKPISPSSSNVSLEGNIQGPLLGEVVVFTGALSMSRREAAEMAAQVGCDVKSKVTKKTTLLILGDQDISKFKGHNKSSKHRKAEELVSKGHQIRIIGETDFIALTKLY